MRVLTLFTGAVPTARGNPKTNVGHKGGPRDDRLAANEDDRSVDDCLMDDRSVATMGTRLAATKDDHNVTTKGEVSNVVGDKTQVVSNLHPQRSL